MVKTVIFDMDGVIVDTEPVHKYAYFKHFEELNIEVTQAQYATYTGNSTRNVFQKLKAQFSLPDDVEDLIQRKRFLFNDAFDTKEDLELIAGVKALIVDLHQSGMELILASSASKGTIQRVFQRFELFPYFSAIVSGEDFPKSKPDPAIFLHAASLAQSAKEECVIIEDSTNGVRAACAADIYCIAYHSENSKLQDLTGARYFVKDFAEINAQMISQIATCSK